MIRRSGLLIPLFRHPEAAALFARPSRRQGAGRATAPAEQIHLLRYLGRSSFEARPRTTVRALAPQDDGIGRRRLLSSAPLTRRCARDRPGAADAAGSRTAAPRFDAPAWEGRTKNPEL